MKKLLILILSVFVLAAMAQRTAIKSVDTTKKSLAKVDTVLTHIAEIDTGKVNQLIDLTGLDDSTKAALKSIMADVPEAGKKADDIVKIIQAKDEYGSTMEFWLQLIGAVIAFLTVLAGLVKKIRALPSWMSPLHWLEGMTGKSYSVDPETGKKVKATVRKVKIPEGYDIEFKKKVKPEQN